MRRLAAVSATLSISTALVLTGCSSDKTSTPASSAPAAANTIVIKNFAFSPASLTVAPGAKVTVTNEDTATHTVTATGNKVFDTGDIATGKTVTFTAPSTDGTYPYICSIHTYMQGTLIVK